MKRAAWTAGAIAAALAVGPAAAEVQVSGLADFVVRNGSVEDVTNRNFRSTSNLDATRIRVFLDSEVSEHTQLFTQLLISGYSDSFLYAAYLRFQDVGGTPVSLHVGLIPSTVGTFAARTYSDRNPLVGVPLVHNHHSVLNVRTPQPSVDSLLAQRAVRSNGGLPVLYDNCWNTGVEAFGEAGAFDWSVGVLAGSVSLPRRENPEKLPQGTARLGWVPGPGLQIGASGWLGPYLFDGLDVTYPAGKNHDDYLNGGIGGDLYAALRYLEIHSEVYRTFWEHPQLPTLRATSGYAEAKYKLRPRWYVAARFGFFEPSEVTDGAGLTHRWDYPVHRVEYGLGYKPARRVTTKLVAQHNRFDGNESLARDHYMVQISAGF